jgi:hypothetical protein
MIDLAMKKNYTEMYMEATNPSSYYLMQKLFRDVKITSIVDTKIYTTKDGRKPFADKDILIRGLLVDLKSK